MTCSNCLVLHHSTHSRISGCSTDGVLITARQMW